MRELVSVSLPEEHTLTWVQSMAEALMELKANPHDVILVDLSLPDVSGMDTLKALNPKSAGIPIIVLSGYDDESISLQALRTGAQDYLVKGEVSSHLLRHAIRYAIERKRLDAALTWERDMVDVLLEHVPDQIYFKDRECRYLRINRALANLFGLTDPLDAVGRCDADFLVPEDADAARRADREVIESNQPVSGVRELLRLRSGSQVAVLADRLPLHDQAGAVIGTFGLRRAVTETHRSP